MLFFELIEIAIGTKKRLSKNPTDEEWQGLFQMGVKQSLVGLLFMAIEKLNENDASIRPPSDLFYKWIGVVTQIEQQNKKLNIAAEQLSRIFKQGGIRSCVLKGQGIARLYPEPSRRQSGDIDLWVEGSRENTLRFLRDNCFGTGSVVIHHVDAHIIEGVESEIHFIPIWMYHPVHNHRLQLFFREKSDKQFSHFNERLGFAYPTGVFNAVYCLVHIFHHLLDEGVGLRQVIDYYYILKYLTDAERRESMKVLESLGLCRFAGALMHVLRKVCNMESSLMLCSVNEKYGKLLLREIMQTGNFGQFDSRYEKKAGESIVARNMRKSKRWRYLMQAYPSEVLCIPAWKLCHWCWRKWNGYV